MITCIHVVPRYHPPSYTSIPETVTHWAITSSYDILPVGSIPVTAGAGNSSPEFSSCLMYDVNYTSLISHLEAGSARDDSPDLPPFTTSWPVTPCRHGWQHETDKTRTMIAKVSQQIIPMETVGVWSRNNAANVF